MNGPTPARDLPRDPPSTPRGSPAPDAAPASAAPHPACSARAERVQAMFDGIACRYDLLNRVLSLGVDRAWRRETVRAALEPLSDGTRPRRALDVATGTADLALALAAADPALEVTGVDFAEAMLEVGRRKAAERGAAVALEVGDGTALPFPDASFDVVTIAYGLRNFDDPDAGLREFRRVLRPGGRVCVLEFPPPPDGVFGRLFRAYFLRVLPVVGGVVSGDRAAYAYLPESVLRFPRPERLAERLQAAGFERVRWRLQTGGVSALHVADLGAEIGADLGADLGAEVGAEAPSDAAGGAA